jgi:hypothetical protein
LKNTKFDFIAFIFEPNDLACFSRSMKTAAQVRVPLSPRVVMAAKQCPCMVLMKIFHTQMVCPCFLLLLLIEHGPVYVTYYCFTINIFLFLVFIFLFIFVVAPSVQSDDFVDMLPLPPSPLMIRPIRQLHRPMSFSGKESKQDPVKNTSLLLLSKLIPLFT